eukprot:g3679.t1
MKCSVSLEELKKREARKLRFASSSTNRNVPAPERKVRAWNGGTITSNKTDALEKFVLRLQREGKTLNTSQKQVLKKIRKREKHEETNGLAEEKEKKYEAVAVGHERILVVSDAAKSNGCSSSRSSVGTVDDTTSSDDDEEEDWSVICAQYSTVSKGGDVVPLRTEEVESAEAEAEGVTPEKSKESGVDTAASTSVNAVLSHATPHSKLLPILDDPYADPPISKAFSPPVAPSTPEGGGVVRSGPVRDSTFEEVQGETARAYTSVRRECYRKDGRRRIY